MIEKFKAWFKKYIITPINYTLAGFPVPYKEFPEYYETMQKIVNALFDGNEAIITINGVLHRVTPTRYNRWGHPKDLQIIKLTQEEILDRMTVE